MPPSSDPSHTTEPYNELPAAPPATGNATAPALATAISTLASSLGNPAKPLQKKSSGSQIGSSSAVMSISGSSGSHKATTTVTVSHEHKAHDSRPVSSGSTSQSVRVSNMGPPLPIQSVPSSSVPATLLRTSSAGSMSLPATSGAVRKLFVTPTANPPVKHPQVTRSLSLSAPKSTQSRSSTKAPSTNPSQDTTTVRTSSSETLGKASSAPTINHPVPTTSSNAKQMSYSRIIASQESTRGQHSEVIEQPVQQIMKTPTIFQDPATQLTKPKKISTYSDAVGKKHQVVSGGVGGTSVSVSSDAVRMGGLGQTGGSYPPASAPGVPSPLQLQPTSKLNLAPGSRPVGPGSAGESADKVRNSSVYTGVSNAEL